MFCICVLIIAAAAVYMVEAYIHTYYAIEYMHGAPLFCVLLAKYAAPVLFLLLCVYFVFRYRRIVLWWQRNRCAFLRNGIPRFGVWRLRQLSSFRNCISTMMPGL